MKSGEGGGGMGEMGWGAAGLGLYNSIFYDINHSLFLWKNYNNILHGDLTDGADFPFVQEPLFQGQQATMQAMTTPRLLPMGLSSPSSSSNVLKHSNYIVKSIARRLLVASSQCNINVGWWSLDLPFERGNVEQDGGIEFNYGALVE